MDQMTLALPADKEHLGQIDDALMAALVSWGFSEARRFHFAIHEAVINAIQAREYLETVVDTCVHIDMSYDGKVLQASVSDSFGGMKASESKKEHCEWCENGRGMMLMAHLVDELTFANNAQGGFTVDITMYG